MSDFGGGQSRNGKEMVQGHIRGAWAIYITDRSFSAGRETENRSKIGRIYKIDKIQIAEMIFPIDNANISVYNGRKRKKKEISGFSLIKVWQYPREMVARYMSYIVQYISSYGGKSK